MTLAMIPDADMVVVTLRIRSSVRHRNSCR